jgi:hypothetical protein
MRAGLVGILDLLGALAPRDREHRCRGAAAGADPAERIIEGLGQQDGELPGVHDARG